MTSRSSLITIFHRDVDAHQLGEFQILMDGVDQTANIPEPTPMLS